MKRTVTARCDAGHAWRIRATEVAGLLLTSAAPHCPSCGGLGSVDPDAACPPDVWETRIRTAYAERFGTPDDATPPLLAFLLEEAADAAFPHTARADQRAAIVRRLEHIQSHLAAVTRAVDDQAAFRHGSGV